MATTPAIPNTDRIVSYSPVGSTSAFVVPWVVIADSEILAEDDLVVIVNGVKFNSSQFSFAGNIVTGLSGIWNGGTLTLTAAVSGVRVIIYSKRDARRTGSYLEGNTLPFTTLDKLMDDVVVQVRDLALRVARSFKTSAANYYDNGDAEMTFSAGTLEAVVAAYLAGISPATAVAGWARTLATAKALYAAPVVLANGHTISVACRATANDGYGGVFSYDSLDAASTFASDGLGFVDNQNRRWKRQYSGPVSIQWFGAGTGVAATDATAFASAVTALTATGGTILVINTGSAYIPNTVTTLASNVNWRGIGRPTINFAVTDWGFKFPANAHDISIDGIIFGGSCARSIGTDTNSQVHDIRITNCDISGATAVTGTYNAGIFLDKVTNIWIEDCYLHGNGIGAVNQADNSDILLFYNAGNVNVNIRNNRCSSTTATGNILCYNCSYSDISGNKCSGAVTGSGNNNGYGIMSYDTIGNLVFRNKINDNTVWSTGGTGIYGASGAYQSVTGNLCLDNGLTQADASLAVGGIAFNSQSFLTISNNVVAGSLKDGIVSATNTDVTMGNNDVYLCTQYGLRLRGPAARTGVTGNVVETCLEGIQGDSSAKTLCNITGNTISNSQTSGIEFATLTDSAIGANIVTLSHNYGIYIGAGARNRVQNNTANDNSQGADNTTDGIAISSTETLISGNQASNSGLAAGQRRGITSDGNYNTVVNNRCVANKTVPWSITGTAPQQGGNRASIGATQGSAVLVGGTVTVATAEVLTGDLILLTCTTAGGTQGIVRVSAIVNATSFTLTSSQGTDTSTYQWRIEH